MALYVLLRITKLSNTNIECVGVFSSSSLAQEVIAGERPYAFVSYQLSEVPDQDVPVSGSIDALDVMVT